VKRGEDVTFKPCGYADLSWSDDEFHQNQRLSGEKAVRFLEDSKKRTWVVKQTTKIQSSMNEFELNEILAKHKFPCVSPAVVWCKGRLSDDDDTEVSFLVIPFVPKSHSIEFYLKKNYPLPSRANRISGLIKFLQFIRRVSPSFFTNKVFMYIGDVNVGQILLLESGDLCLVDFGVCQLVENIRTGVSYKVTAGSQHSNLLKDPAPEIVPQLIAIFKDDQEVSDILKSEMGIDLKLRDLRDIATRDGIPFETVSKDPVEQTPDIL